jgi:hypothetical protein
VCGRLPTLHDRKGRDFFIERPIVSEELSLANTTILVYNSTASDFKGNIQCIYEYKARKRGILGSIAPLSENGLHYERHCIVVG